MKHFTGVFRSFCLVMLLSAQWLQAGILPVNLRCGSWSNPLGIDDPNPRLSWQVVATSPTDRDQTETAYQIQVATSPALLASNQPDLWDSGQMVSAQPFNVAYAGSSLTSAQQVFWQVRVWDQSNSVSAWSPVATWTMGLLNPGDWQGGWLVAATNVSTLSLTGCNWIWYPEGNPIQSAPVGTRYFRKTISVRTDSTLTSATLLLTADNSYVAYVNGAQVGQGADYTVATPFIVTTQLQAGANTIAIAASNGGSSPNAAGLIGRLILKYADGSQSNLLMDATWKAANSLQTNWQLPGFNDSSWTNALMLGSFGISPWGTGVSVPNSLPIFRREFTVGPGLQRALIYICGLGEYELTANGAKVGNALLAPGWTKYDKTCLYDTLDLTASLTNGNNAVGVMLGNGMYNVQPTSRYTKFTGSFGPPKVIAQIELFYTNGTTQVIPTDAQWQTACGPITYSQVYGGEDYDARLVQAGWDQAGFNAASWAAAVVTNGPGGTLRGESHASPPIVATQILQPIQTNVLSSNSIVYDLGQNAAIIPQLTATGPAGSVIQITPAELTNADGTVDRTSVGGGTAYWQYTLAGTGTETWMPKFYYHGCRYLQVALTAAPGSTQLPAVTALSGVVIQSDSTNVGDFSCSYDLFNRIRTLIRWAQRNNLISILTDCPHRERLGWLEQYNLHGPSLRYEFDVGQLFSKTMQDMADCQTASGLQPSIAPEYVVFSGGFRDSPEWGSSVIIVPWQHYLFTGDDTLLKNYYSTMTNYFNYLNNQAVNYFLNYPNGLGDWYDIGPNPPGYSQDTPISLTADAYYCMDAQILAQAAAVLGKTGDVARFSTLATNIGAAFNTTYYSPANGYYATGSQTAQALPLYLGLVSPTNQASVVSALVANVNSQGLTAGDIGHRYLLRALADMGRSDVVFKLHSGTNDPGYGYILNQGATALTEAWDANPSDSQDHFMLGHITEWFYHDLAGIQYDPALPGFQHVIIKPAFVGNITWVNASYDSVRGTIVSDWLLTNNTATINVTIPIGSTGSIELPLMGSPTTNLVVKESGTTIWQNGAVAGSSPGVTFSQVQGSGSQTYQVWTVGSGSYQFVWNVLPLPPPTPTGLKATAGNAEVVLAWNASSGATNYIVQRSTGGSYTAIATPATANYSDTAVTNGTTYYYEVAAANAYGASTNSGWVSATPGVSAANQTNYFNFSPTYLASGTAASPPSSGTLTINGSSLIAGEVLVCDVLVSNTSGDPGDNWGAVNLNQGGFFGVTGAMFGALVRTGTGTYQCVVYTNGVMGSNFPGTSEVNSNHLRLTLYVAATGSTANMGWLAQLDQGLTGTFNSSLSGTNLTFSGNSISLTFSAYQAAVSFVQYPTPVNTSEPTLAWQLAGLQIQFSWPADHTGWTLQVQTNSLALGLGTNWTDLPGSALGNQYEFPIYPGNSSVFFRLTYK